MKKLNSEAVILRRVNYGEADRILTLLTPENGKIRAIAKGVRKEKSKLAGGLELLSISNISYIKGRGELNQIVSSKLIEHFGDIVTDYERVNFAYSVIKWVDTMTEDDDNQQYYSYLVESLRFINNTSINLELINIWARIQFLLLHGNLPNLLEDCSGEDLKEDSNYSFDPYDGCFKVSNKGIFNADKIKVWRILTTTKPDKAKNIKGLEQNLQGGVDSLQRFMQNQIHLS